MIQQILRNDFVFKTVKNQEASSKGHQGTKAEPCQYKNTYTAQGPPSEPICFYFRLDSNTISHLVSQCPASPRQQTRKCKRQKTILLTADDLTRERRRKYHWKKNYKTLESKIKFKIITGKALFKTIIILQNSTASKTRHLILTVQHSYCT